MQNIEMYLFALFCIIAALSASSWALARRLLPAGFDFAIGFDIRIAGWVGGTDRPGALSDANRHWPRDDSKGRAALAVLRLCDSESLGTA